MQEGGVLVNFGTRKGFGSGRGGEMLDATDGVVRRAARRVLRMSLNSCMLR